MIRLSPPESFQWMGVLHEQGVEDLEGFHSILGELHAKRAVAVQVGLVLECVVINTYILEISLRTWLNAVKGEVFRGGDRRTFGGVLALAEAKGLDQDLVQRLRAYNRKRNSAIHHLIGGHHSYREVWEWMTEDPNLESDLDDWISNQLPTLVVDSREGKAERLR